MDDCIFDLYSVDLRVKYDIDNDRIVNYFIGDDVQYCKWTRNYECNVTLSICILITIFLNEYTLSDNRWFLLSLTGD